MRTWLLVLMIALLPLRALVGEAMAGEMMSRHAAVVMAGAAAVQPAQAAHDCMGHGSVALPAAEAPSENAAGAGATMGADCPTCASCQACSAVALAFAGPAGGVTPFGAAPPAATDLRFASAEPVPAVKPPIS
jgi:hypothetical protein